MNTKWFMIGLTMILCISVNAHVLAQDMINKRPNDQTWWLELVDVNARFTKDPAKRANVYIELAKAHASKNKTAEAATAFGLAKAAVDEIGDRTARAMMYAKLALIQADYGDTEGSIVSQKQAESLLSMIVPIADRAHLLIVFTESAAKVGDDALYTRKLQTTLDEIALIDRKRDRSPVKLTLVEALLRVGKISDARKVAESIWFVEQRHAAWALIAGAEVAAGNPDAGIKIAESLDYREDQMTAYLQMLSSASAMNDNAKANSVADKAMDVAMSFLDDDVKARHLINVARGMLDTKAQDGINEALTEAEEASMRFPKVQFKAWALPEIASIYGAAGNTSRASDVLNAAEEEAGKIANPLSRAWALARIAQYRAAFDPQNLKGTIDAAKAIADEVDSLAHFKSLLYGSLAMAYARAGQVAEYRSTIAQASNALNRVADVVDDSDGVLKLTYVQNELEWAISNQATNLAIAGNVPAALTAATNLSFQNEIKQETFLRLAEQEAARGNFADLADWLYIRIDGYEGRALGAIIAYKYLK